MQPSLGPEHYYLSNFLIALDWVAERYADLLDRQEQCFISDFKTLPIPSQALLVRLIMRKGPHFRSGKLNYPEIGNIEAAAKPLLSQGWLNQQSPISADELGNLLRKDEILPLLPAGQVIRTLKKPELLAALAEAYPEPRPYAQWNSAHDEQLYTLCISELCDRLRLMFFGNLSQDWSEFVLADLGIFRYEHVTLSIASRGFNNRQDLNDYLHLRQCREHFTSGQDVDSTLQRLAGFDSNSPHIHTRHIRLLYQLAYQLERGERLEAALELYQRSGYSGARQRRIRVLEKLERYAEAMDLLSQARQAPESEAELQTIERAGKRLARKLGLDYTAPNPAPENRFELHLPRPEQGGVESAVAQYLQTPEAPVHYVENTLISSLFGLLCWDALFAPLPGAFFHPFHSAPADLLSPDFHQRRRSHFEACLAPLRSNTHQAVIRQTFHAKQGIQSPFVFWPLLTEELLEQALHCLPAEHMEIWFRRMLLDISANRSGMPDLIQFWPAQKRYRMIEVKGPGDRLQDNQRRWLALCAEHQMPIEVCYVRWQDA